MPIPAIFLGAKGAAVLGHAAAPHAITAAHAAAPHLLSATAALHTSAVEAGLSSHVLAVTGAIHAKAVAAAHTVATHATHTATHSLVNQAVKHTATELTSGPAAEPARQAARAAVVPLHGLVQGVHHTKSSAHVLAMAKTSAKLAAPVMGKLAVEKFRRTPAGEALVDRVKESMRGRRAGRGSAAADPAS